MATAARRQAMTRRGDQAGRRTLASVLADRDAEHFVGREAQLAVAAAAMDRAADAPTAARILLIHGPGGIGKSTLLREIGRRGEAEGWTVVSLDGRQLDHGPSAAADALAPA